MLCPGRIYMLEDTGLPVMTSNYLHLGLREEIQLLFCNLGVENIITTYWTPSIQKKKMETFQANVTISFPLKISCTYSLRRLLCLSRLDHHCTECSPKISDKASFHQTWSMAITATEFLNMFILSCFPAWTIIGLTVPVTL